MLCSKLEYAWWPKQRDVASLVISVFTINHLQALKYIVLDPRTVGKEKSKTLFIGSNYLLSNYHMLIL